MPNQASNEVLLFTKCSNLNTEKCLYTKKPETILSLFSSPENFAVSDQKVQELNDTCTVCGWYQKK